MAPGGFYWDAIKSWIHLSPKINLKQDFDYNGHFFYNSLIKDHTGSTLRAIPWMVKKGLVKVAQVRAHSGLGMKRDQWFQFYEIRKLIPNHLPPVPQCNMPKFTLTGPTDKDADKASLKELYLTYRSLTDSPRHFEDKWQVALGYNIADWPEIWKRVHDSRCSLRVRSQIWRQLNLNFWNSYMDHAYILRGDGLCSLCSQCARNRWHIITECDVVIKLWEKFAQNISALAGSLTVQKHEMAFGLPDKDRATVLRTRLGFTLRATIMSLRGIRTGDINQTVDHLWSVFLRRLKKELVEEYYTAKLEGNLILFEKRTLVNDFLGHITDSELQWSDFISEVQYDYWNLFT